MSNSILIIGLIISTLILSECGQQDVTSSLEQAKCHNKCILEGWTYGDALGNIVCNCYNCEQTLYFEDNTTKIIKC